MSKDGAVNDKAICVAMGLRISMLRKSRSWTQEYVAEACDLSCSTISRVESGSQFLTIPGLLRLASAIDVDPGKLMPDLEDVRTAEKS